MGTLESEIRRIPLTLAPDPRRVLMRAFVPSLIVKPIRCDEPNPRIVSIFSRLMQMDAAAVEKKLADVFAEFHGRHQRIHDIFEERYSQIRCLLPSDIELDEPRRLLLGAFFTNEYSFESSALFNPSIVPAPDQSGLASGELRFILSLRATGEGHVSSITFRSGVVTEGGDLQLDEVSRFVHQPRPQPAAVYERRLFCRKLEELGVDHNDAAACTRMLPDGFTLAELSEAVERLRASAEEAGVRRAGERALLLAQSNYTVRFAPELGISEKILFPYAPSESNGIEDARFVRFAEEDGSATYYATYTAYDGSFVVPQLVRTRDFNEFSISTLNGPVMRNKGFAIFPRKINGRYAMLGRQDGENIHLMFSDHMHFWYGSQIILRPAQPWQFVQIGNCGSPIETEAGWLVLTHGVGPIRKYCIGAALLDLKDPSKVLGRLRDPLLRPQADEREGYVPNVLYSCGGVIHGKNLVLPYAISDTSTRFAIVPLARLLEEILRNG
jgi:predicted GH43/DUF377 family glycosyl hydrolase